MKVLVAAKRVLDYQARVRVKPDGSGVDTEHLKMSINPFDEIALEEAIRLKEAGIVKEVIVVTAGALICQDILRQALAMGADRAILIHRDQPLEPFAVAQLLQAIVAQEKPSLVILGKQAIDDDCNQTGQLLAGLLGWALGTFISKLQITDNQEAIVTREVDQGLETIALRLPAVVTTDLRLNEPRYITLPNIMKAKSKPLVIVTPEELRVDIAVTNPIIKVESPAQRAAGSAVHTIAELMDILKNKHQLL